MPGLQMVARQVKVKLPLSFFLTEHHTLKVYWGVEIKLHPFLTCAIDGSEWSVSHPGCFIPREGAPGTH